IAISKNDVIRFIYNLNPLTALVACQLITSKNGADWRYRWHVDQLLIYRAIYNSTLTDKYFFIALLLIVCH
ncbi:hypothetical protein ACWPXM_11065, partial [Lactiplantibacillus plantarum]